MHRIPQHAGACTGVERTPLETPFIIIYYFILLTLDTFINVLRIDIGVKC